MEQRNAYIRKDKTQKAPWEINLNTQTPLGLAFLRICTSKLILYRKN